MLAAQNVNKRELCNASSVRDGSRSESARVAAARPPTPEQKPAEDATKYYQFCSFAVGQLVSLVGNRAAKSVGHSSRFAVAA